MIYGKYHVHQTFLRCTKCGNINSIFRKENRQKKIGHKKKLYCYKCKKRTLHKELKENYGDSF